MKNLSIYIHVPFCVRKCLYCDFLSFPVSADTGIGCEKHTDCMPCGNMAGDLAQEIMVSYVNCLCREIAASAEQYIQYHVISVFLGGGTPSLLPEGEVSRIMETIRASYRVAENAEITIEMNPETATEDKLQEYITCGINRISIGLQSTDDGELARIGRIHDYRTFLRAYELARKAGFRNINVDLMAALPEQSVASYANTLRIVAGLAPEHISAYSLILEEGTPLYARQADYRFPTEEEDREMYRLTGEYLASCGYHRYEISNYAQDGFECRHNKVYWQRGDYVGFGLAASSMVGNVRWSNPADMEQYQAYAVRLADSIGSMDEETAVDRTGCGQAAGAPVVERQQLTVQEQMEEYMFLGLRLMCGVEEQGFSDIFGTQMETVYGKTLEQLCADRLLVRERGYIRLTERGIDVSNYVMAQFLFD